MRRKLLTAFLVLIMAATFIGCGDESCPTCSTEPRSAVIRALAILNNGNLSVTGEIFSVDGAFPDIDSIFVDTNRASFRRNHSGPGSVTFGCIRDTSGYASGDVIEMRIYTPAGVSSGSVGLIDWMDDPHPGRVRDSVGIGSAVTVEWAGFDLADWYRVSWDYDYLFVPGSANPLRGLSGTEIVTDTSYTLSDTLLTYNGNLALNTIAMRGPHPDGSSVNITGAGIQGIFLSRSKDRRLYLEVGTGVPEQPQAAPTMTGDIYPFGKEEGCLSPL